MASVTIDELLERARQFEHRLERFYAELRDRTEDNGVKLLTYYLSRHRARLERSLAAVDPGELRRIRSVRLKVDVAFDPSAGSPIEQKPVAEIRGAELLAAAVEHDSKLLALYETIVEHPVGDEAERLIEGLKRLEEKDIVMLKKMIAMHYF